MDAVPTAEITWMVLARDVSGTVRVRGADRLAAVLILDVDTGLVRGIALDQTNDAALHQAVGTALRVPAADLPPGPPARVLCAAGLTEPVRAALTAAGVVATDDAMLLEVQPGAEAEDIFDSFLGHLAGRTQPDQPPAPADWQQLIDQAARLRNTQPWARWSDEQDLHIELHLPDDSATYTAVLMGQAGIQHGLALYPGRQLPARLRDPAGDEPPDPPAGTLLLMLDPPDELPAELRAKAIRYGWPADDNLAPLFMAFTAAGPGEISQHDAHRLTAAVAAVLALDRRGPTLADAADEPVTGAIALDGQLARYAARHRPRRDQPPEPRLRLRLAGHDLLPPDTPVTVGHLSWDALTELRSAATVHRPAPPDAPPPAGRDLPLIVLSPDPADGPTLAAKIAQLDPYGVSAIDTDDGEHVLILAGGHAAEILLTLPAGHPALSAFQRRYRQTHGRHVIMIADPASATGQGRVYGLFECHQPPPHQPRPTTTTPKAKPKTSPAQRSKRKR